MQNYVVRLESEVFKTFRCQKAADSLDIDTEKKSKHELAVNADIDTKFNVGLIVGASGSGKTTLARRMFGEFKSILDEDRPIIEQLPKEMTYDECAETLMGIGLTSVPCWIRPVKTLSNGQKARAEAALLMLSDDAVIDEWTSVVDRTVAKVMSHCVSKFARRRNKRVVLVSCHYDVIEWLNPDWVIDCNSQTYENRRDMVGAFERSDRLRFDIREVPRTTWAYFSKYHYLSSVLPGGKIYCYGLFHGPNQIGFQCFAAYIIGDQRTYFFNRTVVHPDYAGLGLGIHMINSTARLMSQKGYRIKGKFSSVPVYKAMSRDKNWACTKIDRPIKKLSVGRSIAGRETSMRHKTTTYHFDFIA